VAISFPAPLRVPVYRNWWLAAQGSNAGTWMQQVAAAWLMLTATHSAGMVGVLSLAQRGPMLLLTPVAGRLADRRDRRVILAAMQLLQLVAAVGLTVVAALHAVTPANLIALSLVGGAGQALAGPAQLATVSSLVPRESIPAAVSLNSAGFNLARVVGPAIAGLLLVVGGATVCFAVNALSFVAPLVVATRLPVGSAGSRSDVATVRAAAGHVAASPALRRLVGGCAVFTFLAAPLTVLMPVYAHMLGGGPDTLGLLLAAFGIGATVGALGAVRLAGRLPRHRLIPLAMAVFALVALGAAAAPSALVAAPFCALAGLSWLLVFTSTNSAVQLLAPDRLRGRLLAIYLWSFGGPMAISGIVLGPVAGALGMRSALAIASLPLLVYAAWSLHSPVPSIDEPA
jgi:MFS family permease